jgi:hypothetical protein
VRYKIFQKLLIGGTHIILGDFLLDQSRKYKGRFWDLWKETRDDGTIEIHLVAKIKYTFCGTTESQWFHHHEFPSKDPKTCPCIF